MTKDRWEQIIKVVDRTLDLDSARQLPFVEAECKHDRALRDEVVNFLSSIGPSELFWDDMLESSEALVNELASSATTADEFSPPTYLKQAGPYKVIELIARGGMGNVYLAERSDGQFKRKAAIKILRRELTSEHHVKMFYEEREILSSLEHPNIARLYDGGIADGRPYLVMEYVDGVPITSYCKDNKCTLTEKLDLFKQVCMAVEYAHRNLIVHHDLKPDNILVKPDGTVKVLDFGIAKIIDKELFSGKPEQTGENLHMLSIQYAAPEQVTLEKITTATDVYALGLLLYEMITGRPPFELKGRNLKEAEQIICFKVPEKPSKHTPDLRLSREVRGDIDAIVLKALEKEPEFRFLTADQFLEDIRRYQNHLPVHAKAASKRYSFSKFIRRNRVVLSILVFAVIFISGIFAFHLSEVQKQKNIALAGQQQAEFVTGYLTNLFQSASPQANQGDTLSVYNLLDIGKEGLLSLDDEFKAKPALFTAIASSYLNLGIYDEAISLYEQAYEITHTTHGISEELANSAIRLGNAHTLSREFDTAILYYEEALDLLNKLGGDFRLLKAGFLANYARAVLDIGEVERAGQILEEANLLQSELNLHSNVLKNIKMSNAKFYRHNNQYAESEKLYREILQNYRQDSDLEIAYNELAYVLVLQERHGEAIEYYSESLSILRTIYGDDHPNTLRVMSNLGAAYLYDEQYDKAEALILQRIPLSKQHYGENHWRVAAAKDGIGRFYLMSKNYERAEEMFKKSTTMFSESLGETHNYTVLSTIYLAFSKAVNGSTEESDLLFRDAYATLRANKADFVYRDETLFEVMLIILNMHPMNVWHEEIAMLELMKK